MQALPLYLKVKLTKRRIRDWINEYGEDGVYVSFSGGKDSTVLLNLVREDYPRVPAVFCDTGLEYPEVRNFVKKHDNVVWLKPKMTFKQVVEKYGYPMISKEVAECVWGARKYLTRVMEEETLDRQTDRQTAYRYNFDKLFETGDYGDNSRREVLRRLIEQNHGKKVGEGGMPWRVGAVLGILTTENTFDAGLWKDNRQFPSSEAHGDTSEEGKSNEGDYP